MDASHVPYRLAGRYLRNILSKNGRDLPEAGIVCGSGLSGLSKVLENPLSVSYGSIPGFPAHCTVAGHQGEVVFGYIGETHVMCFRGRFHSYEGHDMKTTVLPVLVMRCLNVQVVLITNAAGGLNPAYEVGDIVAITDHVAIPCLAGKNSLVGPNDDEFGHRFPPTSNAYPAKLRELAMEAGNKLGFKFMHASGTYCFVSGPMYESKAECRFLRKLGGDCVGMSTIPEVVASHHAGMQVLCLSLITNKVVTEEGSSEAANHEEVLQAVEQRSVQLQELVTTLVKSISEGVLPKLDPLSDISLATPSRIFSKQNLSTIVNVGALLAIGFVVGQHVSARR